MKASQPKFPIKIDSASTMFPNPTVIQKALKYLKAQVAASTIIKRRVDQVEESFGFSLD